LAAAKADRILEHCGVRGRVVFHPPTSPSNEVAPGANLGDSPPPPPVLDEVSKAVGSLSIVVDLILNGHAHCLEYLRTGDTGHADSNLNWIVCGGSGFSLRRQRSEDRS